MAAEECPGLGRGSAGKAKEEDGRSAKGGEKERIDLRAREEERQADAGGSADQTP